MPMVKRRNNPVVDDKVKFNFDVAMLDSLIRYTQCEYISRIDMFNLKKVIDYTNPEEYKREVAVYLRLMTLRSIVTAMVDLSLSNIELIKAEVVKDFQESGSFLEDFDFRKNSLSVSECEYIKKYINEILQYIEIYKYKDELVSLLDDIGSKADYNVSYYDTIQKIKGIISQLMVSLQEANESQGLLKDFSFSDPEAVNKLTNIIQKMQKPTAILQTGIRQLNAILSPGFAGGRLYTILGGSGKFKSGTLLNIADNIRLFNPQILPYENGMRKCVFFITLENSIEETIERLYDMYSDMDSDLRNSTPEEVINSLRENGNLYFNGGAGGIDICFHYAGNLEISTADIYGLVSELNNKGYSPICIILDYIKRIESSHPSFGDERVRMSFVAKELKTIAQYYQIPVITAMQLNREGNSIIDAAMRESKQDVTRFVGSSSIGNAWDIIEDSDWVCLINLELQKSTQKLFLTFKRLKSRGKVIPGTSDYFNHPFSNAKNIRLEPDVNKESTLSIISLATDLESINEESNDEGPKYVNLQQASREKKSAPSVISQLKGATADSMLNIA